MAGDPWILVYCFGAAVSMTVLTCAVCLQREVCRAMVAKAAEANGIPRPVVVAVAVILFSALWPLPLLTIVAVATWDGWSV